MNRRLAIAKVKEYSEKICQFVNGLDRKKSITILNRFYLLLFGVSLSVCVAAVYMFPLVFHFRRFEDFFISIFNDFCGHWVAPPLPRVNPFNFFFLSSCLSVELVNWWLWYIHFPHHLHNSILWVTSCLKKEMINFTILLQRNWLVVWCFFSAIYVNFGLFVWKISKK